MPRTCCMLLAIEMINIIVERDCRQVNTQISASLQVSQDAFRRNHHVIRARGLEAPREYLKVTGNVGPVIVLWCSAIMELKKLKARVFRRKLEEWFMWKLKFKAMMEREDRQIGGLPFLSPP